MRTLLLTGKKIPIDAPTNISVTVGEAQLTIKRTDPNDKDKVSWAYSVLVRNTSNIPTDIDDGIVVVTESTRNQYSSSGYVDSGLTPGITYYYNVFSVGDNRTVGVGNGGSGVPAVPQIGAPTNISIQNSKGKIIIKWTDPNDKTGVSRSNSKLIRNTAHIPANISDGTVILTETTRNQYSSNGYVDSSVNAGTTYYYNVISTGSNGTVGVGSGGSGVAYTNPVVDIILVGGGGRGGGAGGSSSCGRGSAGGGGGGLVIRCDGYTLTCDSYAVVIGAGATTGSGNCSTGCYGQGGDGGCTTFDGIIAYGGGGGGAGVFDQKCAEGRPGGNGGGDGRRNYHSGGAGCTALGGHNGGAWVGGGGGMGGDGGSTGGAALEVTDFLSGTMYLGGGGGPGGGSAAGGCCAGAGGAACRYGCSGCAGCGGGGGGAGGGGSAVGGGNGGNGAFIIRYPAACGYNISISNASRGASWACGVLYCYYKVTNVTTHTLTVS